MQVRAFCNLVTPLPIKPGSAVDRRPYNSYHLDFFTERKLEETMDSTKWPEVLSIHHHVYANRKIFETDQKRAESSEAINQFL